MCGIFGYLNCNVDKTKHEILTILLNGIQRMEYRGYDSAGLAFDGSFRNGNGVLETKLIRQPGKVKELEKKIYSNGNDFHFQENRKFHFGIAHTRWATHGEPSVINCHPQPSDPSNDEAIATRRGSPLIIGVKTLVQHSMIRQPQKISESDMFSGHTKRVLTTCRNDASFCEEQPTEYFIASDPCAIIEHTREVYYLEEFDIVHIDNRGQLNFYNPAYEENSSSVLEGSQLEMKAITRGMKWLDIEMREFDTFMEKEIFEQPESLTNTLRGRITPDTNEIVLGGLRAHAQIISRSKRLIFIACGTSYHSAIAVRQLMIEMTDVPVMVEIASDFLDRQMSIFRDDACVFISQSGETADTLGALRYCKRHQAMLIGITNVVGSSISRETNCGIHVNAGPEIGVASTKAYTSQIASLILMACWFGRDSVSKQGRIREIIKSLKIVPTIIEKTLTCYDQIKTIAPTFQNCESMLIVGRGVHMATCLEGALLSYIHSEGILSGELKHGTLALIDEKMPVIFILAKDSVYDKSMNALEQILSRKCRPMVLCDEECEINDPRVGTIIKLPHIIDCCQVICSAVPFQLLAMTLAKLRGHDVDCPRNLAKSVTVE